MLLCLQGLADSQNGKMALLDKTVFFFFYFFFFLFLGGRPKYFFYIFVPFLLMTDSASDTDSTATENLSCAAKKEILLCHKESCDVSGSRRVDSARKHFRSQSDEPIPRLLEPIMILLNLQQQHQLNEVC
jgi:hypothetical protein